MKTSKDALYFNSRINKMKMNGMSSKKRGYLYIIYKKYFKDSIQVLYHLNMECLKLYYYFQTLLKFRNCDSKICSRLDKD